MRKYVIVFYIFILLLFSSCLKRSRADEVNKAKQARSQQGEIEPKISFSDLFEEVEVVPLYSEAEFSLSAMPILGAVNQKGDFIVLDNFWTRQILVFNHSGKGKGKIGKQGTGRGQYLYPECIFYQPDTNKYYVYDGDMLRIMAFDDNFNYISDFNMPLYLEDLIVKEDGRIFCYSSGYAGPQGNGGVVFECDNNANIINKYCNQSKNFLPIAESKGGGILIVNNYIYVITPYEYRIKKYNLQGKKINEIAGTSSHYVAPIRPKDKEIKAISENISKRKEYHLTWSHILQIIRVDIDLIGIIFNEPIEHKIYLDLYDIDLKPKAKDILLPNYFGISHGIITQGNLLYLIQNPSEKDAEKGTSHVVHIYSSSPHLSKKDR